MRGGCPDCFVPPSYARSGRGSPRPLRWACRLPGLRCDEGVEFDVSGEIVDEADQGGESALQQHLEDRLGGQPGLRRGGGSGPVGRCGGLAQQLDLLLGQAQLAEHRGVKGDAVPVVDGDADGEAGDLAKNRVELRRRDRAAQPVETGEQGGRCGGGRRQVGYQAEIGREAVEHSPAPGRGVVGRQDGELHDVELLVAGAVSSRRVHCAGLPPWRRFPGREAPWDTSGRRLTNVSVTASAPPGIGHLLRHWRAVRAKSQLDLACDAETTPRYVSFVETGRAQPSRQMVVRLARALDVPLRERNELLIAAGYAPWCSSAAGRCSVPTTARSGSSAACSRRTRSRRQRTYCGWLLNPARCATSSVIGPR